MKIAINLLGIAIVSACVKIFPAIVGSFYQCGERPPPVLNEQGQNVTPFNNLTISRVAGPRPIGGYKPSIFYDGFRSSGIVMEDVENFFRYQFFNEEGKLLEISGHPSDGPIYLGFPSRDEPLQKCVNTTLKPKVAKTNDA